MALKPILDSLEGLDPAIGALYAEGDDGKFILDLDGELNGHPSVAALETAFRKEGDKRKEQGRELKEAKTKLAVLPDDFDPEKYQQMLDDIEAAKAADDDEGDDEGDDDGDEGSDNKTKGTKGAKADKDRRDAIKAKRTAELKLERAEAKYKEEMAAAQAEALKYKGALESTILEAQLTDALLKANIAPSFIDAVRALHADDLRVVEVEGGDGEFSVVAGDDDETPEEYIAEWALSDSGKVFVSAARNNGGGAQGSGGSGTNEPSPWKAETWNLSRQAAIARDDPDRAKRMAREAGKPEPRV